MFHKGALIEDQSGLLEGDGKETRVARFQDIKEIEKKEQALKHVITQWIELRNNQ